MKMYASIENFYKELPAIWLVFSGSFLNHDNAPVINDEPREKCLVDLLRGYLQEELAKDVVLGLHAAEIDALLASWLQSLDDIYAIRKCAQAKHIVVR
jgi:hypothetical protein